jgi:hypothetical protein
MMKKVIFCGIFVACLCYYGFGQNFTLDEYIYQQCREVGVPYDLVQALLKEENPNRNYTAKHKNTNGSIDRGLFQINSQYEDYFVGKYWFFERPFKWDDPYSSAYLGVRIIKGLLVQHNWNVYNTVLSYNCGSTRVAKGNVPSSSIEYAKRIFETLKMRNPWG